MKIILITIAALVLPVTGSRGLVYNDKELVLAIYYAEGGKAAKYPYGIRSVHCGRKTECEAICEKTVRNNRRRFARAGHQGHETYLEFLAHRYCPCPSGAGQARFGKGKPAGVNPNWLPNVTYFLKQS